MTPGYAKTRQELPWLYYPESDSVIINAHNFGGGNIGFGDELLLVRGPTGPENLGSAGGTGTYFGSMGTVLDTAYGGELAFSLNGSNQYIEFAANAALNLTGDLSLGAWIKRNNVAANQYVISRQEWGLGATAEGLSYAKFYTLQTGYAINLFLASALNDVTNWHFVALTHDGATAKLYIDGVLSQSVANAQRPGSYPSAVLQIGKLTVANVFFNGRLDDIRVANRVWSASEISAWFAGGRGYDA